MLQIIDDVTQANQDIVAGYCSAEEHPSQIQSRWSRIIQSRDLSTHLYHSTAVEDIVATMYDVSHDILVIDSVQTLHSSASDSPAGSPAQVSLVSEPLVPAAKKTNTTLIII